MDLDGTLTPADTLVEAVIRLAARRPLAFARALVALTRGRAAFKRAIFDIDGFDPETTPYRPEVVALARRARAAGGGSHLVTGADQRVANAVADHLGVFDSAVGSSGDVNLTGAAKADYLRARFPNGFAYVGDSSADRPVFAAATQRVVVASPGRAQRLLGASPDASERIVDDRATFADWIKTLRIHHWVKNLLIFVPLVLSQRFMEAEAVAAAAVGYVAFGFVASACYLFNDLFDLDADRAHPRKHRRAIAAGRIPAARALTFAVAGACAGLGVAAAIDPDFAKWAAIYFGLAIAYSLKLKRIPLTDLFVIGLLFTLRLVAGMTILDEPVSFWLTSFAFAFCASLAFAKRTSELALAHANGDPAPSGRGYRVDDRHLLTAFGVSAAIAAMIVMSLYFQFKAMTIGHYDDAEWLYFIPLVLFSWTMRIWVRAHRGELRDDPIIFALKDRVSWLHGAAIVLIWQIADKPGFPG